jgi:hypothetical protein
MKPAALIAVLFLGLIAAAHLLRLGLGVPVLVGDVAIPLWVSALGVLGPGALAVWLWREQRPGARGRGA